MYPRSNYSLCIRIGTAYSTFITSEGLETSLKTLAKHSSRPSEKAKEVAADDMPLDMPNPYERQRHICILCKYDVKLDYKNPKLLSQFVSPFTGQLYERNITRLCRTQQKRLKETISLSIKAGYMGFMMKSTDFLKDPQLFDPSNPLRPHKY